MLVNGMGKMGKATNDEFVSRWGDSELDDKQYASVPGWILRNYHKFTDTEGETVGLSADEFQVMVHIMSFKYDVANAEARPSLKTVAEQVGKHISSVRRTVKRMEDKGALKVDRKKKGHPNTYDFGELARQCRAFDAQAVVNECVNATPSVDATPTPSVHASTPLAYTLPEEKNKIENKTDSLEAPKPQDAEPHGSDNIEAHKKPIAKKRTPAQLRLDNMKNAIADAFGYAHDTVTDVQWNEFGGAAKQLLKVGATPQDMKPLYDWCAAQKWSSWSSMAMAKNWANYVKQRDASARHIRAHSGPTAANLAEAALYGGGHERVS